VADRGEESRAQAVGLAPESPENDSGRPRVYHGAESKDGALNLADGLNTLAGRIAGFGTARTRGELVSAALDAAVAAVGGDAGSIWLPGTDGLVCQAAVGRDATSLVGMELPAAAVLNGSDAPGEPLSVALMHGAAAKGALRVAREEADAPAFGPRDRALLEVVAAAAALAIENSDRLKVADRSGDLGLLAEMSREIVSTLDLDRVLRAAVNLAARAIDFDRGAVGLYAGRKCDIRAIAGADEVDATDPSVQDLAARGAWAAGTGEAFYLSDRGEAGSDAERIFLQVFGEDLAAAGVQSGLYLPLNDEEGIVGILFFEAMRVDFADARQRELAAVLAAQATVAIRNAQLYKQVPLADALGAVNQRWHALLAIPRRRRAAFAAVVVAGLAAVTLIKWPLRVVGLHSEFRQTGGMEARALVGGVIARVLVREGESVARGAPVAQLWDAEMRAQRDASLADADADDREAEQAASRGDPAHERVARLLGQSHRREAALVDDQLRFTLVRSPVTGSVLTPRPDERVGARVDAGDGVLLIGRTDTLELDFGVDQEDITRVRPGQDVHLSADGLPQRTLSGRIVAVGSLASDTTGRVEFPVRALVPNADGALRPGMQAEVRVLTAPTSLAGRLLRAPIRTARLLWWRLWS
jgi:biotin carboxyl carrier protein